MTPKQYERRPQVFTAVAWDGSDESATWIVAHWAGAYRDGEKIMVRDSLDREQELPTGSWALLDDATGLVNFMSDVEFRSRYREAQA